MATGSTRRMRLDTLTGVRGLLSLVIFTNHAAMEPVFTNKSINDVAFFLLVGWGEAAVSFFFMLSGFVLVWVAPGNDTAKNFWRRRFFKIYPNHAITWAVGLILMIIAGEYTKLWNVLPSLFLIQTWIPDAGVLAGTNGPSWTLACELLAYLLFPVVLPRLRRIPDDKLWRAVGIVAGVMITVTVLVGLFIPHGPDVLGHDVSAYQLYLLIFFPPMRLADFVLGMLVARIVIAGRWPDLSWWLVGGLFLAGWIAMIALPKPLGFIVPMVAANTALLGKAATTDLKGEKTFLTGRLLVWFGNQSYARYLVHWLVLHYGQVFLGGGPWSWPVATLYLVGCFFVTVGLSALLRRYVEMPTYNRWARPKRTAESSTPVPEPARVS